MSRIYGEPVEVWLRDTHPTRFVWRSRLYAVTAHLNHWTTPAPDPEREFWRVEAVAGLGSVPVAYELRHDLRSGTWLLSRAWD